MPKSQRNKSGSIADFTHVSNADLSTLIEEIREFKSIILSITEENASLRRELETTKQELAVV